jgi:peroxiredoxin Q/BCP
MALPKIGNKAPAFSLLDQDEVKHKLSDYKGKTVVLYFYPKASTPGCTVQACGLRDTKQQLEDEFNAVAIGISPDPVKRLANFTTKQNLNFVLLSDEDHAIADKYGVWGPKKFMGRTFDGIHRMTFIINPEGRLSHIIEKVKTKTHHDEVIKLLSGTK